MLEIKLSLAQLMMIIGNNCLTSVCLWLSDQEGSIVVIWLHQQLCCFVSADACEQPPAQRRHILGQGDKKPQTYFCCDLSRLENWLKQPLSTFPTGGGLKVQEAEADVKSLERTEFLFQTSVSTEVRTAYIETPPTWQGTHCLSFLLLVVTFVKCYTE